MLPLSSNAPETTEHLFTCPALREEHNTLRERTDRIFKKWSIPYPALGHLPNLSIKSHWINILQNLRRNCPQIRSHSHSQVRRCNNLSKIHEFFSDLVCFIVSSLFWSLEAVM